MARFRLVDPVPAHLTHVVYLALGSNMCDSTANTNSPRLLEQGDNVRVVDTSFLYETPPMYVKDQPPFFTACKVTKTNSRH